MASHPELDPARLAVIHDCMEAYDVGDPDSDWPNKIVSRRALAYHDGTIALVDEPPPTRSTRRSWRSASLCPPRSQR